MNHLPSLRVLSLVPVDESQPRWHSKVKPKLEAIAPAPAYAALEICNHADITNLDGMQTRIHTVWSCSTW
eukprot:4257741-Amphidinium_carterae.1